MAINKDDFVASFKQQMKLLTDLQSAVKEAIDKAQGQLDDMTKGGKSVEEVFGPVAAKQYKAGGGRAVVAHSAAGPLGGFDERLLPDLNGRLRVSWVLH